MEPSKEAIAAAEKFYEYYINQRKWTKSGSITQRDFLDKLADIIQSAIEDKFGSAIQREAAQSQGSEQIPSAKIAPTPPLITELPHSEPPKEWTGKGINRLSPRSWLICGGGGYEKGEDGLASSTWTAHGLIQMLESYDEFVTGLFISAHSTALAKCQQKEGDATCQYRPERSIKTKRDIGGNAAPTFDPKVRHICVVSPSNNTCAICGAKVADEDTDPPFYNANLVNVSELSELARQAASASPGSALEPGSRADQSKPTPKKQTPASAP